MNTSASSPLAGPRDPLEEELVRIWQELLEVAPIGIFDNFFDLGGHSLIAPAMVARASETFDRPVPLSLLLENPTVASFADALVSASREEAKPVVPVRTDGTRPPLFFLHGDFNGGGLYCARLARGLTEQPFYAIAPLGSERNGRAASIQQMASEHAAAILNVQRTGPYLLGGHCNGALEALEIARQLRRDGQEVPALVLIEPPAVDIRLRAIDVPIRAAARLAGLDEARRVDMYLRVHAAVQQIARQPASSPAIVYRKLRTLLRLPRPGGFDGDTAPRSIRHDELTWRQYTRAVAAYVPAPYEGSAAVFIGDDPAANGADAIQSWRRVGPRFEFHSVPGGHFGCIGAHVASTASAIDAYLDSALSK